MSDLRSEDVLFLGRGTGVVPWYRTGLPAFHLGCDWAGMIGQPPHVQLVTSLKRGGHTPPDFESYKVVVLQQVSGTEWLEVIRRLQGKGIKVIYEVDDYLHGVKNIRSHKARPAYTPKILKEYELCMRATDAMICSTEWLATKYRKFNPDTFVCTNSVDTRLYDFELPERDSINIGFAGGEGHLESVMRWLPAVERILDEHYNTRFISMGLAVANILRRPMQCVALPFVSIENFPSALTSFDIGIAPAGRGYFFAGKSDLRFLEAGALGIPLVADPFVYRDVVDQETGIRAETVEEAYKALKQLVESAEDRRAIGERVRKYVREERDISKAIEQWEQVFVAVWDR